MTDGMFRGEWCESMEVLYCIENAKETGKADGTHIDCSVGGQEAGKKGQKNQNNGWGIENVEHRDRKSHNLGQPCIGDNHTEEGKQKSPNVIGQRGNQLVEISAATANQSHAGVETGNDKNQCQQNGAKISKNLLHQSGKNGGTIGSLKKSSTRNGTNMSQHGVGEEKKNTGNQTSLDGSR